MIETSVNETHTDEPSHVVAELGLVVHDHRDPVRGDGVVVAEACVPGTDEVRTSVLTTWADVIAGGVAGVAIEPRIPLTLDLEVQVAEPPRVGQRVRAVGTLVRAGRSVVVTRCRFTEADSGALLAQAVSAFVPSPDPAAVFPDGFPLAQDWNRRLRIPLAERVGAMVTGPGVVEVPRRPDGLNAVGAMQGGVMAVAMEEAARSLGGGTGALASMNVRYLRPVMEGPARAVAVGDGPVAVVELTDAATGKLCGLATTRVRDRNL